MSPDSAPLEPTRGDRRGLAGLLGAVGVSLLGTRMSFLAVPWLVLAKTGSPTMAGAVALAELLPYVLVQGLGGPLVDRLGPRRTSVISDVLAGCAIGAVPALAAVGGVRIAVLGVLIAVVGALRGAGDASRNVLVSGVAGIAGTPMERAAGLYDGVNRLASLIGAPLAGVLIATTSSLTVLALDAVTFLASAALVAMTVPAAANPPLVAREAGQPGYLTSLREGFRYLRKDRLLLGIAAMVLVTNTIDQAQGAVLTPVWAREVAHSAVALGLIGGTFSLGAVLGNLALTWLGPRVPRRLAYGSGFLLAGAPRYVAMALAATVGPLLPVVFVAGLGAGGLNPILGAVEYERVPRHLQARVLGVVGATAWAGMPIGSLGGGLLVTALGIRPALWIAAALYLATTLAPFVFPAWRGMNRQPAAAGRTADSVAA